MNRYVSLIILLIFWQFIVKINDITLIPTPLNILKSANELFFNDDFIKDIYLASIGLLSLLAYQ